MNDLYGKWREDDWIMGWKATRLDGTTHGGYRWPLPMPDTEPVTVEASNPIFVNTSACPLAPGDGLCVIPEGHWRSATSGNVDSLLKCIGLLLRWRYGDVLGNDGPGKYRVRSVQVLGLFDVVTLLKTGIVTDLRHVDLRDAADLRGANLCHVDLRDADLRGADLRGADLCGADLRGANLRGADLRHANLCDADLRHANLCYANLRYAIIPKGWGSEVTR